MFKVVTLALLLTSYKHLQLLHGLLVILSDEGRDLGLSEICQALVPIPPEAADHRPLPPSKTLRNMEVAIAKSGGRSDIAVVRHFLGGEKSAGQMSPL